MNKNPNDPKVQTKKSWSNDQSIRSYDGSEQFRSIKLNANLPVEESEPQDQQSPVITKNTGRKNKKFKMRRGIRSLIRFIVVVVITIVVIAILANWNNLNPNAIGEWFGQIFSTTTEGEGFPLPIQGSKASGIDYMGNDIAVVTDTSFQLINKNASEMVNRQHGFSSPVLKTNSNRAMLFDRGGKTVRIENRAKTLFEQSYDMPVLSADIAENGAFVVLTRASGGFAAQTRAYDKDFKELYIWSSPHKVSDIAIARDGTAAACIQIAAQDGAMKSIISILKFGEDQPVSVDVPDTLLLSIRYCGDRIVAVGDNACVSVKTDGTDLKSFFYGKQNLVAYDFSEKGAAVVLSAFDDRRTCTVSILDTSCEEKAVIEINTNIRSLYYDGAKIATLTDRGIYTYSASGTEIEQFPESSKATIAVFDDDELYFVSAKTIEYLKLKKG